MVIPEVISVAQTVRNPELHMSSRALTLKLGSGDPKIASSFDTPRNDTIRKGAGSHLQDSA